MKFSKYFVLFLTIPLLAFSLHKYYISLCEIEYVKEQQAVQITLGIFIDDIEFTLNKDYNTRLNIDSKEEVDSIDVYFKNYLNQHFKVNINNEYKIVNYIGKEYDDNIVRFYLEITNIQSINSIEVFNNSLFRDFENQQNLIKIHANNIHKTFYLTRKNDKGLLKF
ncbi:MAG: hypothetical protein QM495_08515 [Lutibacter sp.]|uniref:DUF6702 family protein n=1 Tax=Lutibacter sp. TaxID=1925666 RepID=UPI00385FA4AF